VLHVTEAGVRQRLVSAVGETRTRDLLIADPANNAVVSHIFLGKKNERIMLLLLLLYRRRRLCRHKY